MGRTPLLKRISRHAVAAAVSFTVLSGGASASAADLTGHWVDNENRLPAFVQSGSDVTLTYGVQVHEGTISGNTVQLTFAPPMSFPSTYELTLSPDETVLEGTFETTRCFSSICGPYTADVKFTRCECDDGNRDGGDGCDARCRVEACHSCTPEPSTCTPLADSTPCEHPSQCIAGGSCNDGVCEGGTESDSCLDMSGRWLRVNYAFNDDHAYVSQVDIAQDGSALSLFGRPSPFLESTGNIDSVTGEFTLDDDDDWPFSCGDSEVSGDVSTDDLRFHLTGFIDASTIHGCFGYYPFAELGMRCASPSLQPSDGCAVDSCQQCSGVPPVCVPVPDSTPCRSSDPCTIAATCEAGECVAAVSDECPACTVCDGAGGCVAGPRDNCRQPDDPGSATLQMRSADPADKSLLRFGWKKGSAVGPHHLGQPGEFSEVTLCVFDESTPTPALLFKGGVNDELQTFDGIRGVDVGWRIRDDGSAQYKSRTASNDGISSIRLTAGDPGRGRVQLKGGGAGLLTAEVGLPAAPLPLPLRAQLQVEHGACFEGTFGADGVSRNDEGTFKAKGTP